MQHTYVCTYVVILVNLTRSTCIETEDWRLNDFPKYIGVNDSLPRYVRLEMKITNFEIILYFIIQYNVHNWLNYLAVWT